MATKRISDLPAKGSTIGATDLVEISEPDGGGGYVSKRVTGAQLGSDTNLANTNLTQTAATNRLYDMNGNILQFDNGQFVVGNTMGSPYLMEVNGTGESKRGLNVESSGLVAILGTDNSNVAIWGQSSGSIGMYATTATGYALNAVTSSTGFAGRFNGKTLIEPSGGGGTMQSSALFEVNTTTQGALLPRMTTTQRDAIASPVAGLEIYNTTTNRKEFYNGTYWRGDTFDMNVVSSQYSPTASTTNYFGNLVQAPTATSAIRKMYIRKAGVIRFAEIYSRAGTAGTGENWSLYIRLNDTTDYLIQTVGAATQERIWTNASMNIPVVSGDFLEIKMINPAWVTSPVNIAFGGVITIE